MEGVGGQRDLEEVELGMNRKQMDMQGLALGLEGLREGSGDFLTISRLSLLCVSPDLPSLTRTVLLPSPCCSCLVSPAPAHYMDQGGSGSDPAIGTQLDLVRTQ